MNLRTADLLTIRRGWASDFCLPRVRAQVRRAGCVGCAGRRDSNALQNAVHLMQAQP